MEPYRHVLSLKKKRYERCGQTVVTGAHGTDAGVRNRGPLGWNRDDKSRFIYIGEWSNGSIMRLYHLSTVWEQFAFCMKKKTVLLFQATHNFLNCGGLRSKCEK